MTGRLRRHRGLALRAGAGAAVLLGVTAGVRLLVADTPPAAAASSGAHDGAATAASTGGEALTAAQLQDVAQVKALQQQTRQVAHAIAVANAAARAHQIAAANRAAEAHAIAVANRAAEAHAIAVANAAARAHQIAVANKAAAARQRATRPAAVSRSLGRDPRSAARALLAARGWSGQFGCLDSLWQRESGWNPQASNPSSGAFGIPQALPGAKMASAGADWRTNPVTQIRWGLSYIASIYGTPCAAWAHSQATGWY